VIIISKRKPLSKKVRFEVFKRDNFTCQYCGRSSPEVILEVDHIKPIKEGGTNNISNLITSCRDCNRGKGKKLLNDKTMLEKQQKQLKELNERREQLEMMMQWREELLQLEEKNLEYAMKTFEKFTNFTLDQKHKIIFKKFIKKYGLKEVLKAIDIATSQYLKVGSDGKYTIESVERAFKSIGGICNNNRRMKAKPYLPRLYYIRGILKNRLLYVNEKRVMKLLEDAYLLGASLDSLQELALEVRNWTELQDILQKFIFHYGGE